MCRCAQRYIPDIPTEPDVMCNRMWITRGRVSDGCRKRLSKSFQIIFLFLSVLVGCTVGILVQRTHPSPDTVMWIGFPGEIFIRLLSVTIIPLIMCSVISGTASADPKSNGKAGVFSLAYILVQNFAGSLIGLVLGLTIKPGQGTDAGGSVKDTAHGMKTQDIFTDLFRNLFPDNIVRATLQKAYTTYVEDTDNQPLQINSSTVNTTAPKVLRRMISYSNSTNLIGLLFFCVVTGMAIGSLKKRAFVIRDFFSAGTDVMLVILKWFMWVSPLGICSLSAAAIAGADDLGALFIKLGLLLGAALGGALIQILVLYPVTFLILTRQNPFKFMAKCIRLFVLSFAIVSSVVVMPEVLRICEHAGCSPRVTRMVVPILTTINASGSALYIALSSIFLIQVNNTSMDAGQTILIFILAGVNSMAVPAAPSGSILILVMILDTIGLPSRLVGVLFTVDWILDRLRTTSNCVSKMMGSAAISYACDTGQEKPPMEATTVQSDEEEKVEFLTKDRPTDV